VRFPPSPSSDRRAGLSTLSGRRAGVDPDGGQCCSVQSPSPRDDEKRPLTAQRSGGADGRCARGTCSRFADHQSRDGDESIELCCGTGTRRWSGFAGASSGTRPCGPRATCRSCKSPQPRRGAPGTDLAAPAAGDQPRFAASPALPRGGVRDLGPDARARRPSYLVRQPGAAGRSAAPRPGRNRQDPPSDRVDPRVARARLERRLSAPDPRRGRPRARARRPEPDVRRGRLRGGPDRPGRLDAPGCGSQRRRSVARGVAGVRGSGLVEATAVVRRGGGRAAARARTHAGDSGSARRHGPR
jgi:hypothetical protein